MLWEGKRVNGQKELARLALDTLRTRRTTLSPYEQGAADADELMRMFPTEGREVIADYLRANLDKLPSAERKRLRALLDAEGKR